MRPTWWASRLEDHSRPAASPRTSRMSADCPRVAMRSRLFVARGVPGSGRSTIDVRRAVVYGRPMATVTATPHWAYVNANSEVFAALIEAQLGRRATTHRSAHGRDEELVRCACGRPLHYD